MVLNKPRPMREMLVAETEIFDLQTGKKLMARTSDMSLGGCYLETSAILTPGTNLKLIFSIDDGKLHAEGTVTRMHPGSGIAVQFKELNREDKARMHRILEYVQNSTAAYDNHYYEKIDR